MTLYEDPHEVVKIDVEANCVTSVTVYPHWVTHYDALALTKQLNSLLHEAANAPAPEQIPSEEEPPPRKPRAHDLGTFHPVLG